MPGHGLTPTIVNNLKIMFLMYKYLHFLRFVEFAVVLGVEEGCFLCLFFFCCSVPIIAMCFVVTFLYNRNVCTDKYLW